MKGTFALLGLAAVAFASPMPQGVSSSVAPAETAPGGCSSTEASPFQITIVNTTSTTKRGIQRRQLDGTLTLTLTDGTLLDQAGRTAYIAANRQFQFDNPPQTGAIYTSGWSLCSNGSLAIGGSAVFYSCLSGDFYNLYDQSQGGQCFPVHFQSLGGGSASATASQISDGQPQATSAVASVSQISDGQPQASTAAPAITQISDGQPQASSAGPAVTQISDGQPQATTAGPAVTQISDGQVQATTAGPAVTQISDGQVQATTAGPAVTQISDGQVQATTCQATGTTVRQGSTVTLCAAPITQISDGQPQAATSAAVVSQISDGQPQAATAVSQISDGQPQAPTAVATFTGGANKLVGSVGAFGLMVEALVLMM